MRLYTNRHAKGGNSFGKKRTENENKCTPSFVK